MAQHSRPKPPMEDTSSPIGGIDVEISNMKSASARKKLTNTHKKRSRQQKAWGSPRFNCKKLQKLYEKEEGSHKYPEAVVENYFEKLQILAMLSHRSELYSNKFRHLGFHKLKEGKRKGQYAIWLTGNWRLILKIEEDELSEYPLILEIVDYHH